MSDLWFNIRFGYWHWQFGPRGSVFVYNESWQMLHPIKAWLPPIWFYAFSPITCIRELCEK